MLIFCIKKQAETLLLNGGDSSVKVDNLETSAAFFIWDLFLVGVTETLVTSSVEYVATGKLLRKTLDLNEKRKSEAAENAQSFNSTAQHPSV